jgi:sensor histidine kinase YesM
MLSYSYHSFSKSTSETITYELPNFWERFRDGTYWIILVFTLLIELPYQKVLAKWKIWIFIVVSILSGAIFTSFTQLLYSNLDHNYAPEKNLPFFLTFLAYLSAYTSGRRYFERKFQKSEQRYQQSQAELQNLKSQLNPHFFFNTLNNLYGTALEENAPRTATLISQLSDMMRYVLSGSQLDQTEVVNELKFIEDYLHLQKIRLPKRNNIRIQSTINYDQLPATIPPLLLIPFIENAFNYGVSVDHPSDIALTITIKNSKLQMVIKNLKNPGKVEVAGNGSGISNTRRRLELLYPLRHKLLVTNANNSYLVELWIDL